MKTPFTLSPDLRMAFMSIGATCKVRSLTRGHKVIVSYPIATFTHHTVMEAVHASYPEARVVKNERDGDFHDLVTVNLNDA